MTRYKLRTNSQAKKKKNGNEFFPPLIATLHSRARGLTFFLLDFPAKDNIPTIIKRFR